MAIKLDMEKAYDRINWNYLNGCLLKFGFHSSIVKLIMHCVQTVSYSILVNGSPYGFIKPSRGLR